MIFVEIVKYVPQSHYFPWIQININLVKLHGGHCDRYKSTKMNKTQFYP